jgi:hypothetical protein
LYYGTEYAFTRMFTLLCPVLAPKKRGLQLGKSDERCGRLSHLLKHRTKSLLAIRRYHLLSKLCVIQSLIFFMILQSKVIEVYVHKTRPFLELVQIHHT